ncbi:ASCH domain-containing protein [Clostridium magnum]|uniref:ASCH domain-containing protein n=1 Tax=Clostridium magnum TaxID=33954 RepID=UPI00091B7C66|nr:ASCH domain-containing protein [Clostridium magnum]SHJ12430.1 ASCH domain-containing protein [Clostridium magnum DSM 2767]
MKTITLIQPWATLIALGEKKFETRSWKTNLRGPLLIHAGKKIDKEACNMEPIKSTLAKHGLTAKNLPTGCIIAKTKIINVCLVLEEYVNWANVKLIDHEETNYAIEGNEFYFGNYEKGRYAWWLQNVEMLKKPIPAKGQQGLWNFNYEEE